MAETTFVSLADFLRERPLSAQSLRSASAAVVAAPQTIDTSDAEGVAPVPSSASASPPLKRSDETAAFASPLPSAAAPTADTVSSTRPTLETALPTTPTAGVVSLAPTAPAAPAAPTVSPSGQATRVAPPGRQSPQDEKTIRSSTRNVDSHTEEPAFGPSPLIISRSGEGPDAARAIRESKLFRAALAEAFDLLVSDLTRRLADAVLGRELQLAGADIKKIACRLIAERYADGPVRLRVAPSDAHVTCELPVVTDERLQTGDAILECRSGDIDARMHVRLTGVTQAVAR